MTRTSLWDAAAVEKTVARLSEKRPAYASILGFYGPVFMAQANAGVHTSPAAIAVDEATLKMKLREGFSLIAPTAFTVDNRTAGKLLAEICDIATVSGGKLAGAGRALASAEDVSIKDLFSDVFDEKGRIGKLAEKMDVLPDLLYLLLYLAMGPSIEAGARQLADHLTDNPAHRSSCPVCGSLPVIGELDDRGRQWVYCSLCWHRWPVKRMVCLFCGNRDSDSLEYLYSENEPEYRVYLCSECRQYLKVVDTRQLNRGFFPPLEQVVSLHLDMTASEKGFSNAVGVGDFGSLD